MKGRTIPLLALLNAVLLAAVGISLAPPQQAEAQGFGGGSYAIISADSQLRQNQDVIMVIDMQNGKLGAFAHDGRPGGVQPMGSRDIQQDLTGQDNGGQQGARRNRGR